MHFSVSRKFSSRGWFQEKPFAKDLRITFFALRGIFLMGYGNEK
jgi:hypothetical protein